MCKPTDQEKKLNLRVHNTTARAYYQPQPPTLSMRPYVHSGNIFINQQQTKLLHSLTVSTFYCAAFLMHIAHSFQRDDFV